MFATLFQAVGLVWVPSGRRGRCCAVTPIGFLFKGNGVG